jgi:hypothetical protein
MEAAVEEAGRRLGFKLRENIGQFTVLLEVVMYLCLYLLGVGKVYAILFYHGHLI